MIYISNNPKSLVNRLGRVHWIFNYLSNILVWEVVRGKTNNNNNKFLLWFNERYHDIAQEANNLIMLVRDIGYDSQKMQIRLFERIIE